MAMDAGLAPADLRMRRRCARVMRAARPQLVRALIDEAHRPNRFAEPAEVFERRVDEGLDLLIRHVGGEAGFGALYAGQRLFEIVEPERERDANVQACRAAVEADWAALRHVLAPRLDADALALLERLYRDACGALGTPTKRHVRTLFIGDCLMPEIMSFLVGPLLDEGVSVDPFPLNFRDPRRMRAELDALAGPEPQLVVVSPFSHARLPEIEALLAAATSLAPRRRLQALVDAIIEQTRALLDALAARFECPVFVHNAALVPRARGAARAAAKALLTARARRYARERLNGWLVRHVAERNAASYAHLFVLDEDALRRAHGSHRLGRFLHSSEFQHATVLSQKLAAQYHARIATVAHLLDKKLVVCDLDNTLWDGVIGEGAVTHHADRQQVLKRLKERAGVVLSIASKNEPANVHFTGGVLCEADFVAPQISWNAKAKAIEAIRRQLNLQPRHMVFLDDRSDERALVQEAFPDILVLDPCDPAVWPRIALWADLNDGSSDVDRTRMYQEQVARDAATQADGTPEAAADVEALRRLGLVISIGEAAKGDLKRVAELVNRTNQWNLCGSRTTFAQVREWHESRDALILVARAADRFGDMGTVCVAVVTMRGDEAEIPVFVLSCRVFGYGVETAMLNELARRCGIGRERARLVGRFKATGQNHPCRNMYADHGFVARDDAFVWSGDPVLPVVEWAELRAA